MAHDVSIPVARWHAHACKAVVCPQAVQAPSIRHSLTPCRTQFMLKYGAPTDSLVQLCACNARSQPAPIENA